MSGKNCDTSDNTKSIVFIVKFCITDRDQHHENHIKIFFSVNYLYFFIET